MNKRLGTLAAAVVLTAVANISSGITQPLPPRPCGSPWISKSCVQPRRMPPVPAPSPRTLPPVPSSGGTNGR